MNKYIFIFSVFLISSCSFLKFSKNNNIDYAENNLIDSVYANTSNFQTLSFRFVAKYSDPQNNMSFFGSAKIIKDSVLYMKFSPGLGITIAELYTTPDTFFIYFPMKNNYYAGNSKLLLDKYGVPLDFFSIQNIITAQFFSYPYFIILDEYEFDLDANNSNFVYSNIILNKHNSKKHDVKHLFNINSNYLINSFFVNDYVLNKELNCNYNNYDIYDNVFFPSNIDFELIVIDTLNLNLKNKKIIFNETVEIDFKIPQNAEIITN